jgi:hypothetical protein
MIEEATSEEEHPSDRYNREARSIEASKYATRSIERGAASQDEQKYQASIARSNQTSSISQATTTTN